MFLRDPHSSIQGRNVMGSAAYFQWLRKKYTYTDTGKANIAKYLQLLYLVRS